MRNNEVCEARGGDCKKLLDLFENYLKKPGMIPNDIYEILKYANDLNWVIMSSEGTGELSKCFRCKTYTTGYVT